MAKRKRKPANIVHAARGTEDVKMCKKIEAGIHTYSLYHKIFYTEAQNLIELLKETGHCYPTKENEENYNGTYVSNLFADAGVKIYIYRYYDYIKVFIHQMNKF